MEKDNLQGKTNFWVGISSATEKKILINFQMIQLTFSNEI